MPDEAEEVMRNMSLNKLKPLILLGLIISRGAFAGPFLNLPKDSTFLYFQDPDTIKWVKPVECKTQNCTLEVTYLDPDFGGVRAYTTGFISKPLNGDTLYAVGRIPEAAPKGGLSYFLSILIQGFGAKTQIISEAEVHFKSDVNPHFINKPNFVFSFDSMYTFNFFCPSGYGACVVRFSEDYHPEGKLSAKIDTLYKYPRPNEVAPFKESETPWGPGPKGRTISFDSWIPSAAKPRTDSIRYGQLVVQSGPPTISDTWNIELRYPSKTTSLYPGFPSRPKAVNVPFRFHYDLIGRHLFQVAHP